MIWIKTLLETLFDKIGNKTATALAVLLALSAVVFTYVESKGYEYKDVIEEYREQAKAARIATDECVAIVTKLKQENLLLINEQQQRDYYTYTSILPRYKKGVASSTSHPVMKYMNYAYVNTYLMNKGLNPEDYINKTDVDFWGPQLGQRFLELELQVMRDKKGMDIYFSDELFNKERTRIILDPIIYNNDVIGINGTIIPNKE